MAGLELTSVKKSFGGVAIIHGIDLSIRSGEFIVFVGPSGCGKSTLLRLIAGLETTLEGNIRIGERDVTTADPGDRGVAMVFQTYALYPHMSVRENMGFGLRMNGVDKDDIRKRVDRAADILHLDRLLERKPSELSGGQRQRVAIGRAIVREPEVFLFDEPLSNLDAELRVRMRLEIANLHKRLGATMIYVTHDQIEAMTLADRIVVLKDGLIEQVGSPIELYDDPDNAFVAGFIGSPRMNFLDAKVVAVEGDHTTVSLVDFDDIHVRLELERPLAVGSAARLGIRPEHFDASAEIALTVPIEVIENLGGIAYAYARTEDGNPLIIDIKGDRNVVEGKDFTARFDAARAYLFDPETGLRLR
ncbi:ABC transporter ATP-binding protein [Thioalkalivibrio sp. HK1]|uniref:ABC transporter ATP-binding protein n=1 Tax=Thioalkalivibrio sp. HK1 TaxID=1469245 RepID=UPI0004724BE1|nr:sn-glycerol-3-phosphate ABC transporter ATP-binding protein UgpC [Thioalkalivibrio sp. HK1]